MQGYGIENPEVVEELQAIVLLLLDEELCHEEARVMERVF